MDAVYKDFENLIHKAEGFLGTQAFCERREAFHVNEHDGDLSALALYFVLLGKDLFRETARQVALDFRQLFIKGERSLLRGVLN